MQSTMKSHRDDVAELNSKLGGLQNENLKLNADIKVIRTEHSEVLHVVHGLEDKNRTLLKENQILKDMIYGGKSDYKQEIEQNVYNAPRALPAGTSELRNSTK